MNVGRHIYALLKRHSAVFVKGLGTFRRVRNTASFDVKRKVVLPPLSYIEFEPNIEEGYDFTLYVQQSNQLDKIEADNLVHHEVDHLLDLLNRDGQVTLEELGQLVTFGSSFVFKPFDLSGFQFVPIEDPYLKVVEENVSTDSKIEDVVVESAEVEEITTLAGQFVQKETEQIEHHDDVVSPEIKVQDSQENDDLSEDNNYFDEDQPNRSNAVVYALIAIVALIALGGIYYYSIITKKLENVDQLLSAIDSSEKDLDTLAYQIETNDSLTVDSTLLNNADSTAKDVQQIVQETNIEPVLHKYTIVIGTHPKMEQAEAEAVEYQKRGFKNVRALPSNIAKNRKRVIWDTYPTKELRDSALNYVQKNVKSDAWPTVL